MFKQKVLILFFLVAVFVVEVKIYCDMTRVEFRSNLIIRDQESPYLCLVQEELEYVYYEDADVVWEPNNKFGLYIYAENRDFFEIAQELVNSSDGSWGYVLIPYNVKDRDYSKWRRVFTQLYNKELVPVVQLHAVDIDNYEKEIKATAEFLNSFIWPIKYRYVSVYNEPNDSKFWFGDIDPEGYARILDYTIRTFKSENKDFYMLNGALNISASSNGSSMDAFEYMRKMNEAVPGIFEKLDGWASHPYPQPNFSGNPYNTGRWSIRAYEDELNYLKNSLGVTKNLPVFITETGWAHAEGESYSGSYLPVETVAGFIKTAYKEVWLKDARVRAVMPFTIRYDPPFDHFSWVNKDNVPYYHYEVIKDLDKIEGKPPVLREGSVTLGSCE